MNLMKTIHRFYHQESHISLSQVQMHHLHSVPHMFSSNHKCTVSFPDSHFQIPLVHPAESLHIDPLTHLLSAAFPEMEYQHFAHKPAQPFQI